MKYKDIPRKKFTPKQLELLEKVHWLRCKIHRNFFSYIRDFDLEDQYEKLSERVTDKII